MDLRSSRLREVNVDTDAIRVRYIADAKDSGQPEFALISCRGMHCAILGLVKINHET